MQNREPLESAEIRGRSRHEGGTPKRKRRAHPHRTEGQMAGPQVIARIPRVSRVEEGRPAEEAVGDRFGRLFGARVSGWVLAGGAALLVVAAVSASLVSQISSSKDDADSQKESTALRPEGSASDASTMPRRSHEAPAIDTNQATTARSASSRGSEGPSNPYAMSSGPGNRPSSDRTRNLGLQASPSVTAVAPATAAWQTPPGPRRADAAPEPGAGDPPVAAVDPAPVYRSPRLGGLVNAIPAGERDPRAYEPPPEYRTATRTRYADDPRESMPEDRNVAYPAATMTNPYVTPEATNEGPREVGRASDYRDSGPSPGYRDRYRDSQAAPSYRDNGPPPGYPSRGPSSGYDSAYPARPPVSAYEPGYATRDASLAPESVPYADRRAAPGAWSGSPAAAARPTWSSAPTGYPSGSTSAYPTTSAPSYPATGYTARESWPPRDYGTGPGAGTAVQSADYEAAQFEGTIEKPSARTSYERTRPSIR